MLLFFSPLDDLTELFRRRSRRPVGCGDVSREMMYEYDEGYRAKVKLWEHLPVESATTVVWLESDKIPVLYM